MSGEYIVVSPIPQNLVLRYGKTSATLWPSRRIVPQRPAAPPVSRLAAAAIQPPALQPAVQPASQPAAGTAGSTVKLANVTSLYSDQLTDTSNEH
jgi:hypothetical protein